MIDNKRRPFTSAERAAVFANSGGLCGICQRPPLLEEHRFHVDHFVSLFTGGTNAMTNLQAAHGICNLTKSAKDRPSWMEPDAPTGRRRLGTAVYESAFGFVEYAVAVAEGGGIPFVPIGRAPDGGRFIRKMDLPLILELLEHGAYLVDRVGGAVDNGSSAIYFFWPHVAMRDRRYNGGYDSKLDRVKGSACGFVNSASKSPQKRISILDCAARIWLGDVPA